MKDKERILMNIAVDTAGTVHDKMMPLKVGWTIRYRSGRPAPQFIPWELAEKLKMPMVPGDIIRCCTNPNHKWGIAELVNRIGYSTFMLREIGGTKLLRMGNEDVDVLRFMNPHRLYTGLKNKMYRWAHMVFNKRWNALADHCKRFGGVELNDKTMIIWCRAHIWLAEKQQKDGAITYAQPKKFSVPYNKKTRLKDIVAEIKNQGFGEDFIYTATKPTEGQTGCITITKEDINKMLA
jgi:hypothetical protein